MKLGVEIQAVFPTMIPSKALDILNVVLVSLRAFIMVCGCRLEPPYEPPMSSGSEAWKAPSADIQTPDFAVWWEVFDDDVLNALEQQAVENSPTLIAAMERVVQARAFAGAQCASLFPQFTLDPSYSDSGRLFKIFLPATPGIPPIPPVFRVHQLQYTLPLDLSYQIDLWGKLQGQCDSAYFNAQAQAEAYQVALLTLTTDLASTYFQLRAMDTNIDVLRSTLETRRKNLSLNQARYDKGLAANIDVSQAAVLFYNADSDLNDALRQRAILEDAIAALIGLPPADFCLEHNPLREPPPAIPAGLPSDILAQRPDLAQAERTMASQHALIGVAYAAFLPALELTGNLGYSSPDLRDFLRWKSRLWTIGADISQSVFDGGRNQANLVGAWASYREAVANYQQQVLTAFKEVEDALNNLEWQANRSHSLEQSVAAAKHTLTLSNKRYKQGLVTYLEVVESERSELETEINAVNVLSSRYVATVQLIKALGGSWTSSCVSE